MNERPTIEELEKMLASNDPLDIEIQPDGSVRAVPDGTAQNSKPKILTVSEVSNYY